MPVSEKIGSDTFRIAIAQLNPVVGDITGNIAKARAARAQAAEQGADLLLLTELFVSGYPPEDLVLKPAFVEACEAALLELASDTIDGGPGIVIGVPLARESGLHNAVAVLDEGRIVAERYKVDLPNYSEFDEKRTFQPGPTIGGPINFRGLRIGLPICEDVWGDYGVCETLEEAGAEILLVANASPYQRGKVDDRIQTLLRRVIETGLPIVYANMLGGQDELVFDGGSFVVSPNKSLALQMPQFEEGIALTTWHHTSDGWRCDQENLALLPEKIEADYRACMIGLRDYVNKNGFADVILGLSGGLDSALCAAIAVDALGAERVRTVMLPYRYTTSASLEDAQACAKALGCHYEVLPIAAPVEGFLEVLAPSFAGKEPGVAAENLQSRARGTLLMALSNMFGSMVVTTGNKSEMAVGYATLYGDMNGGFNPIKDVYKTEAYALSRWRNDNVPVDGLGPEGIVIPQAIIDKAPSAELRENQSDQDSLPPYPVLDDILECLIEFEMSHDDIVARGYENSLVSHVESLLYGAEYKRRQSAPGVKLSLRNLGRDRRYPITNRFREG